MGKQEETRIRRPVAQTGGESGGAREASGTHGRQAIRAGRDDGSLAAKEPGLLPPRPS